MKNKDRYMLSRLDILKCKDEDRIQILYLYPFPSVIAVIPVLFDETPYTAFMRWLEADSTLQG